MNKLQDKILGLGFQQLCCNFFTEIRHFSNIYTAMSVKGNYLAAMH